MVIWDSRLIRRRRESITVYYRNVTIGWQYDRLTDETQTNFKAIAVVYLNVDMHDCSTGQGRLGPLPTHHFIIYNAIMIPQE